MTTLPRVQTDHDVIANFSALPAGAIVVAVDASVPDVVLDWATDHATAEGRPLVLAHAAGPIWAERTVIDPHRMRAELMQSGEDALDHALTRARHRAGEPLQLATFVCIADPVDLLVTLSSRASLLVLGSHGRGPVGRLLLGSVGVPVAQRAACPVVVHRPTRPGLARHGVLVGIDATDHSRSTLEVAFRIASTHRLPLTVMHTRYDAEATVTAPHIVTGGALDLLEEERLEVAETIAGLREDHPDVHTTVHIARGRPEETVAHLAGRVDLVVVGRHDGRRGPLVAGTAISILEHSTCPVVVVPDVRDRL